MPSEWSFTICPMPYNHIKNMLGALLVSLNINSFTLFMGNSYFNNGIYDQLYFNNIYGQIMVFMGN